MSAQPEKKPLSVRLDLVAVVAVAAFALGGWFMRSPAPAPVSASAEAAARSTRSTASGSSPALESTAAAIPLAADSDLQTRLAALRSKLPGNVEDVLKALSETAKTNPALAIDLAQELGRTEREKATWVTNVMQQWADHDAQAAWQWLGRLSNDRMQELAGGELGSVVLGAMARQDPRRVVANLDALLREGNGSESISTPVAVHLGLTALIEHEQGALAKSVVDGWARDPAKLALEAAAFEVVSMSLAKAQPRETGEWLRSLPANDERNAAFAAFTAAWAAHDPRSALQWAETLPVTEGQQAALRRTVSDWIEQYPGEISTWLGDYLVRVPPSAATDSLVETVINVSPTLRAAPQTALQWTNLISDPAKRVDYHERIAVRWAEQDAAAALAFVANSAVIPAAHKPAIVQRIQNATAPRPSD